MILTACKHCAKMFSAQEKSTKYCSAECECEQHDFPTPEEIARMTSAIRGGWDDGERRERQIG